MVRLGSVGEGRGRRSDGQMVRLLADGVGLEFAGVGSRSTWSSCVETMG